MERSYQTAYSQKVHNKEHISTIHSLHAVYLLQNSTQANNDQKSTKINLFRAQLKQYAHSLFALDSIYFHVYDC